MRRGNHVRQEILSSNPPEVQRRRRSPSPNTAREEGRGIDLASMEDRWVTWSFPEGRQDAKRLVHVDGRRPTVL